MRTKYCHILFSTLVFTSSLSATTEFETVVQASKPRASKDVVVSEAEQEEALPAYPWMALAQAGISAVPTSGALSFGSLRYRAFSSPQLRVLVDGYDLSDSGTGIFDAYDLPLFASNGFELDPGVADHAVGGSLTVTLPIPNEFKAHSRATFGSSHFGMIDMVAGSGQVGSSRALLGLQLATTRGDFAFSGGTRSNNDHVRILGFAKTEHSFKHMDLGFFFLGRHHEGGLAGSLEFPTQSMRLLSQKLLIGSTLSFDLGPFPLSLRWQTRFDRTQSQDLASTNDISFLGNSLTLRLDNHYKWADTYAFLESNVGEERVIDGRFKRLSTRHEFGVNTAPWSFWSMRFKRSMSITAHSDAGWYLGFATDISAKPLDALTIGLKFGKGGRPPSLSEMYGPTGLIAGNANLEPEKVYDAGFYTSYSINEKLNLDLDLYYAHMSKAILYLANEGRYEPTNADHVHRAGIGFAMNFKPTDYFESKSRVDWVWSKINATNSPYPGATPLALTIDGRIGKESGIFGRLNTILNAGSYSDMNATNYVSPYVFMNASLHVPLLDHARAVFAVTNLADVKWAQSSYGFPMPGREFFITLEIFS